MKGKAQTRYEYLSSFRENFLRQAWNGSRGLVIWRQKVAVLGSGLGEATFDAKRRCFGRFLQFWNQASQKVDF